MDRTADLSGMEDAPTLDMHRTELKLILERYVSSSALVVGRRNRKTAELTEALEERGYVVHSCEGPGRKACPLLAGDPCSLRESADVTIAFVDDIEGPQAGSTPKIVCAAHGGTPAVVALEGSFGSARRSGRYAVIGGLRRAEDLAAAADEVRTDPS